MNNKKDLETKTSIELTKMFLDGDERVSLRDIKRKEFEETVHYKLRRWSFNIFPLKIVLFFPVIFFVILFEES